MVEIGTLAARFGCGPGVVLQRVERPIRELEIILHTKLMEEYTVQVHSDGTKWFSFNEGWLHRFDGPAIDWADGDKEWYLHGKKLTEEEFNAQLNQSYEGKVVEIDGVKYTLTIK